MRSAVRHDTDALAQEIQRRFPDRSQNLRSTLTHQAATEARMPHERTFRSWSPMGSAINRRALIPAVRDRVQLFKLFGERAKAKYSCRFR